MEEMANKMDTQRIEGLASRESLPVGVLVELLFGKSAETLQELGMADRLYPDLAPKGRNEIILAYENFSEWAVALIHPNPGHRASLLDILKSPVNTQDIYSWICKNQSSLYLSSDAKLFIKSFKENRITENPPILDHLSHTVPHKPSSARHETNKLNTQSRHKSWQKAYRELKRTHPGKSDRWCAIQISNMPIGKTYKAETIRKNMKK